MFYSGNIGLCAHMEIIKKITVRYFRSIYTLTLNNCRALNVISGRNDCGKSNVLRALNLFFNEQTDWQKRLLFYHDFCAPRLEQVRKESVKGKQFISVEIEFFRPTSYAGSLPLTFSVTRTWLRDGFQYQESTNLETLGKAGKLPSSLLTARRGLQTFLNKIHFEYVPAIKDRAYSEHLLARLQTALLDSTIDDSTGIPKLASNLAKSIQRQVNALQKDFHDATGLNTEIRPPRELSSLFQAFSVSTGNNPDQSIPLSSRGDGIQARYLSSVLNYISVKSNKFFIWGFEEPENSLEFRYAEELADDFLSEYSANSQIFITTHSPAFVGINHQNAACFRAFQTDNRTEVVNLSTGKAAPEHKRELEHELGVLSIQKQVHELYASKLEELKAIEEARSAAEQELRESKLPLLLVEGKWDKKIIEVAWKKLRSSAMPFRVRVADPVGDGSAGASMLAKMIEGIHPDDGRSCVALFDQDKEGIQQFDGLSKNFSVSGSDKSVKLHSNGLSFAVLLPVPEYRAAYLAAQNHMIEFMFSDDVLKMKVNGKGISFEKVVPKLILGGQVVKDSSSLLKECAADAFPMYRKIAAGKDVFAENIVPKLPKSEFNAFELLFGKLEALKVF